MCSMTLGVLGMVAAAPLDSAPAVTCFLVLTGLGGSTAMPPMTGIVLASVPRRLSGTASAAFNTFRQLGGAVGIAVFGTLITHLPTFVAGMQVSLVVTACLLTAAAVAALRIRAPEAASA
jgi:DHA2 family methylenomycin A resistance protein-like MFS transporter